MVDTPAPRDGASTEEEVRPPRLPHLYLFDLRLCDLDILKEKWLMNLQTVETLIWRRILHCLPVSHWGSPVKNIV